ncbi:hypothetical protein [Indioceanicola profundi]|uniref:hypothetical protein n=1 Tax=Indioceanicola profundi TaxID=2220096 RepID=UPI000E6AD58C|nr:hypothetical protein [Indioceanicola profundi]
MSGIQPGPNRSTHFLFEHKVFTVEGCRFVLSRSTEEPVMMLKLGKLDAEVPVERLYGEFKIDPKGFDGQLLKMVVNGLNYVREIRPGDTIPNELIDGTASWRVDERHYLIAKGRLTVQLVTWLTGGETVISSPAELEQIVEDPTTKARVNEAFRVIADKLAISGDPEVVVEQRIETLAKELAFIEALRERMGQLAVIRRGLEAAHRIYKNERTVREEIVRMQSLSLPPITDLEGRFAQVDAQTGEILAMLNKFEQNVSYIREMRDDLHQSLMPWDELLDGWQEVALDKGPALEALLKKTYQHLARKYSQASHWRLANRAAPR